MIHRLLVSFAVFLPLVFAGFHASAEPYRITAGDELIIFHSDLDEPEQVLVDVNGQIRGAPVGGIDLAGASLDEAEQTVELQLKRNCFLVEPEVSMTISSYASVVVGGDVMAPGRFAFQPGMTVAGALALAGGLTVAGPDRSDIARATAETKAGMRIANLDIAVAAARLSRFEALVAGARQNLSISKVVKQRIPAPEAADLDKLLERERHILEQERARTERLLASWYDEITTIEAQVLNFDARITVQKEIVESAMVNLQASKELSDRGLQTSSRLAAAEQLAAQARSRVLELEAAKIAAARAVSVAKRERALFVSNQERAALLGIQEMEKEMETAIYRFDRFREHQQGLRVGRVGLDALTYSYVLQTPRQGRPTGSDITQDTSIQPGETLIVSAKVYDNELDG